MLNPYLTPYNSFFINPTILLEDLYNSFTTDIPICITAVAMSVIKVITLNFLSSFYRFRLNSQPNILNGIEIIDKTTFATDFTQSHAIFINDEIGPRKKIRSNAKSIK